MNTIVICVIAYLRTDKIFLHPNSRTIKGFWGACEPIVVTTPDAKKSRW